MTVPYPRLPLDAEIREEYIETDDLTYHVLRAGGQDPDKKLRLVLLLHGFPELAFSWRKVMVPIAHAGYHVIAYDQRGYGRTSGWDTRSFSDVDLNTFALSRLVTDAVRLIYALGYTEVRCVIGHDFGSLVASLCALMRSDIFKR
jgi:pimeloyl-ACP methyl ester carboxylesterase